MSIDYVNYSSQRRSLKIYTDSVASGKYGGKDCKIEKKYLKFVFLSAFNICFDISIHDIRFLISGGDS